MRILCTLLLFAAPFVFKAPAAAAPTPLPGVCIYNATAPIGSGIRDFPGCDSLRNLFVNCRQGCGNVNTTPFILRSSSPTTCTSIFTGNGDIYQIINSGAAQSAHLAIYMDQTCNVADLVYGDGSSLTLGMGQIVTLDLGTSVGFSYTLDSPVGANVVITH